MLKSFATATAVPADFWRWPNFTPAELADKMSGRLLVETEFLDRLQAVRTALGWPLILNSAYRTPEHNRVVSDTGDGGPHTTARAVDVRVYGPRAVELVSCALAHGFTGIGLAQKGAISSRFVHLDDLPGDASTPRPWVWTY
jgi:uncharacterized protein YcbK (DUF882 family)